MTFRRAAAILAILALIAVPYAIREQYYVNIASQILLYAVFALGLNILVGYAGLVSLGHAGISGAAAYAIGYLVTAGFGHAPAILGALAVGLLFAAVFAALSLRSSGISFIMITLALGEIVWGLAYRWTGITNGDNGISVASRPAPFGLSLASADAFYDATLIVFLVAVAACATFVHSPLGAALCGTRDQPRRMNALGFHVRMIRFWAFMFSGLLSTVAGILFAYYYQFVSPPTVALTASAEVLLMVISGGAATLVGPIVGAGLVVVVKNVVSGIHMSAEGVPDFLGVLIYVLNGLFAHWNFLLGAIFVAIVVFMPEGLVPGTVRLSRAVGEGLAVRRRLSAAPPSAAKAGPIEDRTSAQERKP